MQCDKHFSCQTINLVNFFVFLITDKKKACQYRLLPSVQVSPGQPGPVWACSDKCFTCQCMKFLDHIVTVTSILLVNWCFYDWLTSKKLVSVVFGITDKKKACQLDSRVTVTSFLLVNEYFCDWLTSKKLVSKVLFVFRYHWQVKNLSNKQGGTGLPPVRS